MHIARIFPRLYPTDTQFLVHSDLFYSFIINFWPSNDRSWPRHHPKMTFISLCRWKRSFHQLQAVGIFEKRLKLLLFLERNQTVIWIRLLHHKSLRILCNTFSLHCRSLNNGIFDQENIESAVRCNPAVRVNRTPGVPMGLRKKLYLEWSWSSNQETKEFVFLLKHLSFWLSFRIQYLFQACPWYWL